MKTVIRWLSDNEEFKRIELSDTDATVEAVAQTVIALIASVMSMSNGDIICIDEEPDGGMGADVWKV